MYMAILLTFANQKCSKCDHWMPKREEEPTVRQARPRRSLGGSVCTQGHGLPAAPPLSAPVFNCPWPAPHSRRLGGSFPGGPAGSRRQGPKGGTFSVPPYPCQVPGLARKPRGQGWVWRARGFRAGTPRAEPLPSANPEEGPQPGWCSRQAASSIFSKASQAGKEVKGSPGATAALSFPSLVLLSSFCFTAPLSEGYGNLFNEILWETQQVWLMTCRFKLPDNKALLTTSVQNSIHFESRYIRSVHRVKCL